MLAASSRQRHLYFGATILIVFQLALHAGDTRPRFKVTIQDDKAVVVEPAVPVDPTQRIRYSPGGFLAVQVRDEGNRQLHLSHQPTFHLDGQIMRIGPGGRFEVQNAPLPKAPGGRERFGTMSVYVHGDLRITFVAEVVPTKPAERGQRRRLDAVMLRYTIENKGKDTHKVGMRGYIDSYIIDNDGALFAAPTMPGKVLDGIELKDKTLPDYVQVLQRPDLKNPGFVAHATLNLGGVMERPNRVVLGQHVGAVGWDMPVQQAGGDSAMAFYWDPKEIKPGGKREVAYAYGQGIAAATENEGRLSIHLSGSFEPGKLFTISANVADAASGQSLTLDLPEGMERIDGKEVQPVPPPSGDEGISIVLWKGRVLEPGQFPIRVRCSTGVTQTKIVSVTKES